MYCRNFFKFAFVCSAFQMLFGLPIMATDVPENSDVKNVASQYVEKKESGDSSNVKNEALEKIDSNEEEMIKFFDKLIDNKNEEYIRKYI